MIKTVIDPVFGEVTLSRTRRATRIALSVRPDGSVRLSYPWWLTQRRALQFLDEKREWIEASRRKMADKYGGAGGVPRPLSDRQKADLKRKIEKLRAEAKERLPGIVARLAAEHGFDYGAVRVKATKSRWGSCSARNDINLSLFLVLLPNHLAEYIVLHELCHTVHKNHSAHFHALLDRVTEGRHRRLNKELRAYRPDIQTYC